MTPSLSSVVERLCATDVEDWGLILYVCEQASDSQEAADQVATSFIRVFSASSSGSPTSSSAPSSPNQVQLNAARLWGVMMHNCSSYFFDRVCAPDFLNSLRSVILSTGEGHPLRASLIQNLGGIVFAYCPARPQGSELHPLMYLWLQVKPPGAPEAVSSCAPLGPVTALSASPLPMHDSRSLSSPLSTQGIPPEYQPPDTLPDDRGDIPDYMSTYPTSPITDEPPSYFFDDVRSMSDTATLTSSPSRASILLPPPTPAPVAFPEAHRPSLPSRSSSDSSTSTTLPDRGRQFSFPLPQHAPSISTAPPPLPARPRQMSNLLSNAGPSSNGRASPFYAINTSLPSTPGFNNLSNLDPRSQTATPKPQNDPNFAAQFYPQFVNERPNNNNTSSSSSSTHNVASSGASIRSNTSPSSTSSFAFPTARPVSSATFSSSASTMYHPDSFGYSSRSEYTQASVNGDASGKAGSSSWHTDKHYPSSEPGGLYDIHPLNHYPSRSTLPSFSSTSSSPYAISTASSSASTTSYNTANPSVLLPQGQADISSAPERTPTQASYTPLWAASALASAGAAVGMLGVNSEPPRSQTPSLYGPNGYAAGFGYGPTGRGYAHGNGPLNIGSGMVMGSAMPSASKGKTSKPGAGGASISNLFTSLRALSTLNSSPSSSSGSGNSMATLTIPISTFASQITQLSRSQSGKVIMLTRRRVVGAMSVTHEFLVLEAVLPNTSSSAASTNSNDSGSRSGTEKEHSSSRKSSTRDGCKVFIRLDRRPSATARFGGGLAAAANGKGPGWTGAAGGLVSLLSSAAVASDSAVFATCEEALLHTEVSKVDAIVPFRDSPTLWDLGRLLEIVESEAPEYRLRKENCWFFCSVIQEVLTAMYRGHNHLGGLAHPDLGRDSRDKIIQKANSAGGLVTKSSKSKQYASSSTSNLTTISA